MRTVRRLSFAALLALSGVGVSQATSEPIIIESYPDAGDLKPYINVREKYKSKCRRRTARGWR
jgi:hypothetical protein